VNWTCFFNYLPERVSSDDCKMVLSASLFNST